MVPLKRSSVQNLVAQSPNARPSMVTARLECIRIPRAAYCSVPPFRNHLRSAELLRRFPVDAELRGVMQSQEQAVNRCGAILSRLKMSCRNPPFPIIDARA